MNALTHYHDLDQIFKKHQKIAIYLDYDGTLTSIVSRPDLAVLSEVRRSALQALSEKYPVAVISGRDRQDVEKLVGLKEMYYAGSHGFDISGPHMKMEQGEEFLPDLDNAENELKLSMKGILGVLIERKKYAIAIHYRQVDLQYVDGIEETVSEIKEKFPRLRMACGKKIFELQPNLDWNKGKALMHLLDVMQLNREEVLPIYIGDDLTDEDAFEVLIGRGVGISVQDTKQKTFASFTLKNPDEVYLLFERMLNG